ncbi:uncharacterized protein LOC106668977 isoform X2 [Cimex lectularius]|uniref:Uncharacterized protein n=1 Tax=Cimex lectularius TaxID=79782 RepID=A0A8I6TJ21_CIMLE|nr:uncharacterized protein LOC106668977 isoform X2 [Cimex lectularius]
MKSEGWTNTFLTCLALVHGVMAPATYLVRHLDDTENYKKPIYISHHQTPVVRRPINADYDHQAQDLTSEIIREISEIRIPQRDLPAQLPNYERSEEEEEDFERAPPDFGMDSSENSESANEGFPVFRDEVENDSSGYREIMGKYKVTEKIPDDNKYKPPRVKVVPVPPPCNRPPPPTPQPPKPKPTSELWSDNSLRPFNLQGSYSSRHKSKSKPRIVGYQPYIIRRIHPTDGATGLVIRHHIPMPRPPHPPPLPPIVKEVHIHHHHGPTDPAKIKMPVAVHILKDPMESSLEEDDKLDFDLAKRYRPMASSSALIPVISHGNFAEPPSLSFI